MFSGNLTLQCYGGMSTHIGHSIADEVFQSALENTTESVAEIPTLMVDYRYGCPFPVHVQMS